MKFDAQWITIETAGQPCAAYRARPAAAEVPMPAILLIQEAWGVDDHIIDLAGRVAAAGYLALAPDLYSVGGRPAELSPDRVAAVKRFLETVPPAAWTDPEARTRALSTLPDAERESVGGTMATLFGRRDSEVHLAALSDACRALRDDPECEGRVGSVGWCMGGALSARLAARERALSAAVVFYGSPPPDDEIPQISCPLLGFYGAEDTRITAAVPGFAQAMHDAGRDFEYHVYPGAPHAFFNDTRRSYRADAARDAWARCLMFFAIHVGPVAS